MKNTPWLVLTMIVIAIDQLSKYLITQHCCLYKSMPIFSWLNIVLYHNYGAAFSFINTLGGTQRWLFIGIAILVSFIIVIWLLRLPRGHQLQASSLSLILAGALGNAWDRFYHGYVIDFIDFHIGQWHYPAFNIADSAITTGVILLLIHMLFLDKSSKK